MSRERNAGRLSDKAVASSDDHWCAGCPNPSAGPSASGASNVLINNKPALRKGDKGLHSGGCNTNLWLANGGSSTVLINNRPAFRMKDATKHSGGPGSLAQGSSNVLIGDIKSPLVKAIESAQTSENAPLNLQGLIAAGVGFAVGTPKGLIPAMAGAIVEALPWLVGTGLTKGIFKIIKWITGKSFGELSNLISALVSLGMWVAMHTVKIKGKTLSTYANWYFTNLLDNLLDGQPKVQWDLCPAQDSGQPPTAFILSADQLKIIQDKQNAAQKRADERKKKGEDQPVEKRDISKDFDDLIKYYQPIQYEYADDLRSIHFDDILQRSELVIVGKIKTIVSTTGEYANLVKSDQWGLDKGTNQSEMPLSSRKAYLDIEDSFARWHVSGSNGTLRVYARAYITSDSDNIHLQYVYLRSGSYLPTKRLTEDAFQHEGDGEYATIVVRKDGKIAGSITGGHGYSNPCDKIVFEEFDAADPDATNKHSRPVIFVAYGSHAVAPLPGKREARHGANATWLPFVTDWHPPQEESGRVIRLLPPLLTASDDNVREAIFSYRVAFGEEVGCHGGHEWIDL